MQTNMDMWAGAGVVALDQDELLKLRGGEGPFLIGFLGGLAGSLVAGVILYCWDNWEELLEGFGEGYALGMEGD